MGLKKKLKWGVKKGGKVAWFAYKRADPIGADICKGVYKTFFKDNDNEATEHTLDEIKEIAMSGCPEAQFLLGHSYRRGENGVAKSREMGVHWFKKAAEQGHAEAQYELGKCYKKGKGIAENKAEAREWFRKAAAQGHKKAQEKLK
jgi:TPR repeat protein